MPIFAMTAALPGRAPEMLAEAGEVRDVPGAGRLGRERLLELVEGVDVAVTMLYDRVDEEFLDAAGTNLRGVCNVAVGFDNVDLAPVRGAASSSPTRLGSSMTRPRTSPSP